MVTPQEERGLHRLFEVGIVLKGINALLELVFGSLLLFVNVGAIVQTLAEHELIDDPNDFIATHAQQLVASHLSPETQYFAALYLLSHGIIKAVLVAGLLRDKLWAYPASLAILALFVAYQSIAYARTHSLALLALTLFDGALIWLIYHEYRYHAKKRALQ